jgi:hypothetical protein
MPAKELENAPPSIRFGWLMIEGADQWSDHFQLEGLVVVHKRVPSITIFFDVVIDPAQYQGLFEPRSGPWLRSCR